MPDWRVENAEHLRGLRLQRLRYTKWSEQWDHDHCAGCWAKFAVYEGPEILHEGYTTCEEYARPPGYEWICPDCFSALKEQMGWTEAPSAAV